MPFFLYGRKFSMVKTWLLLILVIIVIMLCLDHYSLIQILVTKHLRSNPMTIYEKSDVIYIHDNTDMKPLWYISPSETELKLKKSYDQKELDSSEHFKQRLGVYAAFYHPVTNTVRVLFNMDLSKQSWIPKMSVPKFKFYCAFYGPDEKFSGIKQANFSTRYLVDCPVFEAKIIPSKMFFFRNDSLWNSSMSPPWLCPITNLRKRKEEEQTKGKLAVCLGSLSFPTLNWLLLVQFLEHYKFHGASKIFVFQKVPVDRLTEKIIAYYRDQGFVEHIHNPIKFDWCPYDPSGNDYDGVFCGRMTFRNYCNINAAYHYKYVAFVDFDELMTPINTALKLTDILDFLDDPTRQYGSFVFNSVYHIKSEIQISISSKAGRSNSYDDLKDYISSHLPVITWTNMSEVAKDYWPKSIVKPETVDTVFVHIVKKHFPGWEPRNVTTHEGIFHHFKNASQWLKWQLHEQDKEAVGEFKDIDPSVYFSYEYMKEIIHKVTMTFFKLLND